MRDSLAVVVLLLHFGLFATVSARAQQGPQLPMPGPEHALLKQDVGTWDATVELFMAPGAPPAISKGTEENTLLGRFWLLSRFKSEMMNQPFEGLGTLGFDPGRKKYVGTWIDSMTPGMSTVEGVYDPATKTLTAWVEGPELSGKVVRMRETTEWKDSDTRIFTMHSVPSADGTETISMRITYKRRVDVDAK